MARCAICPRAELPGRCRGEANARICELVDPAHPRHQPEWMPLLRGEAAEATPEQRPPVVVTEDLVARLRACPWWVDGGCRCGMDLCTFRFRRRKVAARDCAECLAAGGSGSADATAVPESATPLRADGLTP
jgi:hypothetical protein